MKALYQTAKFNQNRKVKRFDDQGIVKSFSACLYVLGERQLYNTLNQNSKESLPATTTLQTFINSSREKLREGEF